MGGVCMDEKFEICFDNGGYFKGVVLFCIEVICLVVIDGVCCGEIGCSF